MIYCAPFGCCHMLLAHMGYFIHRTILSLQKVLTEQLGKCFKESSCKQTCSFFDLSIPHPSSFFLVITHMYHTHASHRQKNINSKYWIIIISMGLVITIKISVPFMKGKIALPSPWRTSSVGSAPRPGRRHAEPCPRIIAGRRQGTEGRDGTVGNSEVSL